MVGELVLTLLPIDERYVVKEITRTELESFLTFAPSYFQYIHRHAAGGDGGGKSTTVQQGMIAADEQAIDDEVAATTAKDDLSITVKSALAKLCAVFRVERKDASGKITKSSLVVMDNVLYGKSYSHVFDLKGSTRNRHVDDKGDGQTLLDENLLECAIFSPL
jgi:1-phosphatidylinositol-3-phosphate 5-kinase